MRTLTFLAIAAITLSGCPEPPEPVAPQIEINLGDTNVEVNLGDDDSAEESTPSSDDDSAESEAIPTTIEIRFTTAFSGLGPTLVAPPGSASMGAYQFIIRGKPGRQVTINNWHLAMLTKTDPEDIFTPWSTNAFYVMDYVESLTATTWPDLAYSWSSFADESNVFQYANDFTFSVEEDGETVRTFAISAEFGEATPEDGTPDGMAIMWEGSGFWASDENGNEIESYALTVDNGTWANPTVQAWINTTPAPLLQVFYLGPNSSTWQIPSGEWESALDSQVLDLEFYAPTVELTIVHQEVALGGLFSPATSGSQFADVYITDFEFGGYDDGDMMSGYPQEGFAFDDQVVIPAGESRYLQIWVELDSETELEPGNNVWAAYNLGALKVYDPDGNTLTLGQIYPGADINGAVMTIGN